MKKYVLIKKQNGGTLFFDKIFIDSTNENATKDLKKELIELGYNEDMITIKKSYTPSDVSKTLKIMNTIEKNDKQYYDELYIPDKFSENGDEFVKYLENTAKEFSINEIAEYYNFMDIINISQKNKYKGVMYLKDSCRVIPYFKKNLDSLYEKTKDYDIILLSLKYTKDKFDTIQEHLCKPNKKFVEENVPYFPNNVNSAIFSEEMINIIFKDMQRMKGQFWFEIAKKILNLDIIVYYSCTNLIGVREIATEALQKGLPTELHSEKQKNNTYKKHESDIKDKEINIPQKKYNQDKKEDDTKHIPKKNNDNVFVEYDNMKNLSDRIRDGVRDGIKDSIKDSIGDNLTDISNSIASLTDTIKSSFLKKK